MKQENTQLRLCADPFRSKLVYLKIKNEVIPKKKRRKKTFISDLYTLAGLNVLNKTL